MMIEKVSVEAKVRDNRGMKHHICYDPFEQVWFLEQWFQTSEFQTEVTTLSCHKSYKAASAALRLIQKTQEDT